MKPIIFFTLFQLFTTVNTTALQIVDILINNKPIDSYITESIADNIYIGHVAISKKDFITYLKSTQSIMKLSKETFQISELTNANKKDKIKSDLLKHNIRVEYISCIEAYSKTIKIIFYIGFNEEDKINFFLVERKRL